MFIAECTDRLRNHDLLLTINVITRRRTAPDDATRCALQDQWRARRRENLPSRPACPPGGTRGPAARGTAADAPPAEPARRAPPRHPPAPALASRLQLLALHLLQNI